MADTIMEDTDAGLPNDAPGPRRVSSRGRLPRLLAWLRCESDLRRARAALPPSSAEDAEFLRRSRLALELGERVIDPVAQPRHGSGAGHAADLFRQAVYWALAAKPPTALDAAKVRSPMEEACPDPEQLPALQRLMSLPEPAVFFAGLEEEQQRTTAVFLRACAMRLLEAHERPRQRVERLLVLRVLRFAILPLTLAFIVIAVWVLKPEKLDLAAGKPWRTSSVWAVCQPEKGLCGGARTLIKFHTNNEMNPWFEIDLGSDVRFSSMTIRDRSDVDEGRSIPLIVEVSNDGTSYREVTRRTSEFSVWRPSFEPQVARYVRLRVPRVTYLHLEEVKVHQ